MVDEQINASPSITPTVESAPINETAQSTIDTSNTVPAEPVKQEKAKTFTQDQLNIISADVKRRTEARLRAEHEAQLKSLNAPKQQEEKSVEQAQEQSAQSTQPVYTEEQIYNIVKQRQERDQTLAAEQAINTELWMKIKAAGKEDKLKSTGLGDIPADHPLAKALVPMLNSIDNVADVLDDFDANPVKVANFLNVTMLNPIKGFNELQALSQSIKRNKEALAKEQAPEPRPQLKPSSYGLGGGASSISDKRRNPTFKF